MSPSYKTMPNENTSLRASNAWPAACSGDIYATVPRIVPARVRLSVKPGAVTSSERDRTGSCFDSSSEFTLPNGAKRSPDASWIPNSRWNRFTKEEKQRFTEICPDFVIELRSPSDRVADLEEKMEEYIANGSKLGWLLDPIDNRATIFRPGEPPLRIDSPIALNPVILWRKFGRRRLFHCVSSKPGEYERAIMAW